jgi:ABC-type branched-subunit amino acid transport system permease subunit
VQALGAFVSAFALYQLTLYILAVSILGGTRAFAPPIIGQALLVNAVTLVALYGLNQLVAAAGLLSRRRRAHASPAPFA